MLWICFWKCKVLSASISNKGHFSLFQEIGYLAWWLGFIENSVGPPAPTTRSSQWDTWGPKEAITPSVPLREKFSGSSNGAGQLDCTLSLAWLGLLYVLSLPVLKRRKIAIFPLRAWEVEVWEASQSRKMLWCGCLLTLSPGSSSAGKPGEVLPEADAGNRVCAISGVMRHGA